MSEHLITLETAEEVRAVFPTRPTMREWVALLCQRWHKTPPPCDALTVGTVRARVNHGRWIVHCPFCRGAMLASKAQRWFWCVECGMERNARRPMLVIFPGETDLRTIEMILTMRPDLATRNWTPNETIAQLARENLDHGCVGRVG